MKLVSGLVAILVAIALAASAQAGGTITVLIDPEGSGNGTVVDTAAGIACFYAAGTANGRGPSCPYELAAGTSVSLVATASAGSVFVRWIVCPGTQNGATCSFVVPPFPDPLVVEARFEIERTLSVSVTGGGTVSSAPPGISCPADCAETTTGNVAVTLSASPAPGSTFAGWGGDCAPVGTGLACTLSMLESRSVTASFAPVGVATLTVSLAGRGAGGVTSTPAGVVCGDDCAETVAAGTPVTLAADAAPGSVFVGWGGACTGTGPCSVTVAEATAVTATFDRLPVDARVLSVRVSKTPRARLVRISLSADVELTVRLRLVRGSAALRTLRARLSSGSHRLVLPVGRRVAPGAARLVIRLTDPFGSSVDVARTVRLPPP